MDVFGTLKGLNSVAQVSGIAPDRAQPLRFVFFVCPKMTGKGLRPNEDSTGLRATYVPGLSQSTLSRVSRVERFMGQIGAAGIKATATAIYAAADALTLFPRPMAVPSAPATVGPFAAVPNGDAVARHFAMFGQLYRDQPWRNIPGRFVVQEEVRLRELLPGGLSTVVADDFVRRVLAGFALDGLLLAGQAFGACRVILGVESPGVAKLQNAALSRDQRLPVVQLR